MVAACWKYFKKNHTIIANIIANCTLCSASVKRKDGGTSNLWTHLRNHHLKEHNTEKGKYLSILL
jgi:hypothetical protein